MKRLIGFVAGICVVLCMSSVSVSMAVVARAKLIDVPYLVFFSCLFTSLGAFFWAHTRKHVRFTRKHLKDLVTISIAGTAAVIPFFIIFTLGPAMMDWAENALFPIFVIALGIIMEKEYPSGKTWLGASVAFFGFTLFLVPAVKSTIPVPHFYVYAILLPLLGAGGSAVSIMTMSRLSKKGVSRFYAMAIRYALPSFLLLIFSLLYGNAQSLTGLGILATLVIGAGLMNGALYDDPCRGCTH